MQIVFLIKLIYLTNISCICISHWNIYIPFILHLFPTNEAIWFFLILVLIGKIVCHEVILQEQIKIIECILIINVFQKKNKKVFQLATFNDHLAVGKEKICFKITVTKYNVIIIIKKKKSKRPWNLILVKQGTFSIITICTFLFKFKSFQVTGVC